MILGPPGVSLSDSLLPYTTLFRYPAATAVDRSASSKANRSTHRPKPVSVKKKSVMSACSLAHSETLPAVLKRPGRFCSGPSSSPRKCLTRPIEVGGSDSPSLKLGEIGRAHV